LQNKQRLIVHIKAHLTTKMAIEFSLFREKEREEKKKSMPFVSSFILLELLKITSKQYLKEDLLSDVANSVIGK
jgi:hypothetical protein